MKKEEEERERMREKIVTSGMKKDYRLKSSVEKPRRGEEKIVKKKYNELFEGCIVNLSYLYNKVRFYL